MCSAALEEMLSYFCEQQDCWTDILTVADETLFHPFLTIFLLHLWFSQSDKKKKKKTFKMKSIFHDDPGHTAWNLTGR